MGDGIEQGFEEVFAVFLTADDFQVGSDLAAFLGLDGVAGNAVGAEVIRDDVASGGDVAAFEEFVISGVCLCVSVEFGFQRFAHGGGFDEIELDGGVNLVLREFVEPGGEDFVGLRIRGGGEEIEGELFGDGVALFENIGGLGDGIGRLVGEKLSQTFASQFRW